jgi:TonB-linked SusC/RagA family outer membrane protein
MNLNSIEQRLVLFLAGCLMTLSAFAQSSLSVKGRILDSYGEPIIGASIRVQGMQGGTVSDIDGNYTLSDVKSDATLDISYIGFVTQNITVNGRTEINVTMKEDNAQLDEVIVVGYAVGSKHTVSGAIDRVKAEDMNKGVVTSAADALKGKIAGVVISQAGGDPTSPASIRVRGTTSLSGGNDPLIIIDGIFSDMNIFNSLAPSDIESVTVLKDASETAQYGSRGASGVIVVTTVKGKNGVATLNYNGQFGVNTVFKNLNMMSAAEYREVATKKGLTFTDMGGDTNFLDEIERNVGLTQNHNISFASGNDLSNMRASLGFVYRQGALKNSDMKNFTVKLDGTQYAFNKRLKLELGILGSQRNSNIQYDMHRMFYSATAYNPTYPNTRNEKGEWDEDLLANEIYNPLGLLDIDNFYKDASVNVHGKATWTILEGLYLSAFGSYSYWNRDNKFYIPNNIRMGQVNGNGWAYIAATNRKDYMGNIQLTYTKDFGAHHIDALALMEGQKYTTDWHSTQAHGFETNYFSFNNLKAGANVAWGDNQSNYKEYVLSSYMVRLNYMFMDRYIATVNIRTDGSSKLGSGQKWGWFPSASLGWIISEEPWMKGIRQIDNLKIRAGYGVTGNQDAIDPYTSLELMEPNGITSINGTKTTTFAITSNSNPDLRWEVKKTFDAGFDLSMFKNRLNVTFDWYHSETSDMLYTYTVPVPPFTYNTLLANMGTMTNTGFELSIGGDIVKTKDFGFNSRLNLAYQKNKLKSLSGTYKGQELTTSKHIAVSNVSAAGLVHNTGVAYLIEGQPIGVFYLPHCTGIDEKGQYIIEDLDGNKVIDTGDSGDRQVCGQSIPKWYMGWNFGFNYKNWDLTMQFNGAFGHKIYNATSMTYSNMSNFPTYNLMSGAANLNDGKGIYDNQISDYWLEKGDYVNFEYASIGYKITKDMLKSKWVNNIRLALSVNNICTITSYSGLTPMINSASLIGNIGLDDKNIFPLSRTYTLSLSVNF